MSDDHVWGPLDGMMITCLQDESADAEAEGGICLASREAEKGTDEEQNEKAEHDAFPLLYLTSLATTTLPGPGTVGEASRKVWRWQLVFGKQREMFLWFIAVFVGAG